MKHKNHYIKLSFLYLISLILLINIVCGLQTQDAHRNYCIPASHNLSFDIQLYPGINGIYTSFVNKNTDNITDLNYSILILKNNTKIISRANIGVDLLEKNTIYCHFFDNKNFVFNEELNLMVFDLKYKYKNELYPYYSAPVNDYFNISKCIIVNRWNREEILKYNGNKVVTDYIIFKKICDKEFKINLEYKDVKSSIIAPYEASLFYNGVQKQVEAIPKKENKKIGILIDEGIPHDELITLELTYDLQYNLGKKENLILFPFFTLFNDFNTKSIIPERVYVTVGDEHLYQEVTDVGLYRIEISIPDGFTHSDKARELVYDEKIKQEVLKTENNSYGIIYPSFSCLNISSFPSSCIHFDFSLTPLQESSTNKIIWQSMIINGRPKGISFSIKDIGVYRYIWVILLIISLTILYLVHRNKKGYIEVILSYFAILFAIKTITTIPQYFTLFDIVLIFTILIVVIMALFNKLLSSKKYQEKNVENDNMTIENKYKNRNETNKINKFIKKIQEIKGDAKMNPDKKKDKNIQKIEKTFTISYIAGIMGGMTVLIFGLVVNDILKVRYLMALLWFSLYVITGILLYLGGLKVLRNLYEKDN